MIRRPCSFAAVRVMPMPRVVVLLLWVIAALGCGADTPQSTAHFNTSGNREADQRAEQRVARDEQIKASDGKTASDKKSLYDKLGGEAGLTKIVDDFTQRVMADPRVNWDRKGVTKGGVLGVGGESAEWKSTPQQVEQLKSHLVQFLALASGGPSKYQGRDIKKVHEGMQITNTQFDAAVGDMKATLDKLGIADAQQQYLLAILESTRSQIVEVR